MRNLEAKPHTRIPLTFKLSAFTTAVVLGTATLLIWQTSRDLRQESEQLGLEASGLRAKMTSTQVEETLDTLIEKTRAVGLILSSKTFTEKEKENALAVFFRTDKKFASVEILNLQEKKIILMNRVINDSYLKLYNLSEDFILTLRQRSSYFTNFIFKGETEIINASQKGGAPLVTIGTPLSTDSSGVTTAIVIAHVALDLLQKNASKLDNDGVTFVVDKNGMLLAHPDENRLLEKETLSVNPIVREALSHKKSVAELPFKNLDDGIDYIGAYSKTKFGPIVITYTKADNFYPLISKLKRRAFELTGYALFISLFFAALFSASMTTPLQKILYFHKRNY